MIDVESWSYAILEQFQTQMRSLGAISGHGAVPLQEMEEVFPLAHATQSLARSQ
ncbi:MAG TPA: hypothetical protein VFE62_03775 [Gemmataceae bacterium]|nr:hypothetical protein [Gemmataceae bacterium]